MPGASDAILGAASGLALAANTLFVVDDNRISATPDNERVLIYQNVSSWLPAPTDQLPQGTRCPACVGQATVVLGQPDFVTTAYNSTANGVLREPTAAASNGTMLLVADTDNNRVLIWNSIPTQNGQNADFVLGQPNFTSYVTAVPPTATSMRGPQAVWIDGGRIYVADTQNHRVLIWTKPITQNGQAADLVLGQPDMTTFVEPDLNKAQTGATASNLLNPVSVTTDPMGRLLVTDLGHNRVLIWNSIPTQNAAPADIALGQPDLNTGTGYTGSYYYTYYDYNGNPITTYEPGNISGMCASTGTDSNSNLIYPNLCAKTLNLPRYAVSDGARIFVADGGNNRVLVYNQIPTASGAPADVALGQLDMVTDQNSDTNNTLYRASTDSMLTPTSLAWDGTNLFVSDPFNRRVLVFSPSNVELPYASVRNAASREIFAVGSLTFSGTINAGDWVKITITNSNTNYSKTYKYTVVSTDTLETIVTSVVALINAGSGDPYVLAVPDTTLDQILLVARTPGDSGNSVGYSDTLSSTAQIAVATGGSTLAGGGSAAKIAPGTLVTFIGDNMSDNAAAAPASANPLPTDLGGVEVFVDGIQVPLLYVSPTQVNAQIPYEINDATSVTAWIRAVRNDGSVTATTATGVPIVPQNPGIFTRDDYTGPDPRPGVVLHASSFATGTIYVEGTTATGDVITVTIQDNQYQYTATDTDTNTTVRDALIQLINSNPDEVVTASPGGLYNRVRLTAKMAGPEGNGIPFSATEASGDGVVVGGFNVATCCANVAGSLVDNNNPAQPGETIIVYGTGLGLVGPDSALQAQQTGTFYTGPDLNQPNSAVSALAGGSTANVIYAGLKPGSLLYEVQLELNANLPTDPLTQCTIAQDVYVSNIVTFPVVNNDPTATGN